MHSLEKRVSAVERRVRRLRWCYALSYFFLAALAMVAAALLVDYFLRLHDPGLRWILSLAVAGGLGWAVWRIVAPTFAPRRDLVVVAQRIEDRFPVLEGRLSSAIAFLSQSADDPLAGSLDLRRAVVAETEAISTGLDFEAVIDARRPRRLLILLAVAFLAAAGCTLAAPALVRLGLVRMAMPWGANHWPARHSLAFTEAPRVLAIGDDFEVELVDKNGELPEMVELQIRDAERGGMKTHGMKRLGERMVFRLDNVGRSFAYRAVGGDDYSMEWTTLQVVSPPTITELAIEVTPPAYTGLAKERGGKLIRALAGSHLTLRGAVDKPIRTAALKGANGRTLPVAVAIAPDGRSFHAPADPHSPWVAEKSGEFWCEISDETQVPAGRQERIELQVVADAPPTISWETPADHALVTPRALVPVRGLVKDDLAIARIELRYLRPDASDEGEHVTEIYLASGPPASQAEESGSAPTAAGQTIPLDFAWDLALIPGLAEGAVLAVRIVAEDFKPQTTTAVVRRLTIISEQELENRVVQQQFSVLTQLAEVLRLEREARDQTAELEIQFAETVRFEPRDLSHLQSAELNQRQVHRLLTDPQDGVERRIAAMLEELAYNRVSSHAAADRMKELLEKVRSLSRQEMTAIAHSLTSALKMALASAERGGGFPAEEQRQIRQSLAATVAGQERVIAELEAILGELSQWDSFSRLAREVGQIRTDQSLLADETDRLRLEMAAGDAASSANRATARQLARRQLELARRYEKLQSRMDQMRERLAESDPLVAGTLADALDVARRLAIAGQLRSAAGELTDDRVGSAYQTQQAVLEALEQLQDVLSRRRDAELARTAQSLRDTAAELDPLLRQHQELRRELQDAAGTPGDEQRKLERLSKQAEALAKQVEELSRKLERLQARRAAQAGEQAAAAMHESAAAAADQQLEDAQDQAAAAQDLLEETRRQLQQQIAQAQQDLLREQLARFEQHLEGLMVRQSNVLAETRRLQELRDKQEDRLTAPQQATLRGVAAEQRLLADESRQLQTSVQAAAAFVFAMEGAEQRMISAAQRLDAGETGVAVQSLEEEALSRLTQIRDALRTGEAEAPAADDPPPQEPGQSGDSAPPAANVAELKLLKLMQEAIAQQTAELEKLRQATGSLSADQMEQLELLAREQGKLADMVTNMIEAAAEADELFSNQPAEKEAGGGDERGKKSPSKPMSLDEALLKELEDRP